MSPCSCPESSLTSVTFSSGAVLLRCPSHEAQTWLVDGRTAPTSAALSNLRALFDDRPRGARPASRVRAPRRAPGAVVAPLADAYPAEPSSEALVALLRERGFTGSWAVA
jgi:hypothetical protein